MNKIGLIIKREYSTRVKKKSFILMTLFAPILFAALMVAPALLMTIEDDDFKRIAVIDETALFNTALQNTQYIEFHDVSLSYFDPASMTYNLNKAKADLKNSDYYALLYIPHTAVQAQSGKVQMFSYKQPNMSLKMHVAKCMEKCIENIRLGELAKDYNITDSDVDEILQAVQSSITVYTTTMTDDGDEKTSSTEVAMIFGYIFGFLIYMFVFMYGSQVMRGVIEEKSNRIVEVIVSSVKPVQLMLGKIVGVALVGLTQFVAWVTLTIAFAWGGQSLLLKYNDMQTLKNMQTLVKTQSSTTSTLSPDDNAQDANAAKFEDIFKALYSVDYTTLLLVFLIYFVGGYLLYAAMFAIVGAAVDNETDSQQFQLPISAPLLLAIFVMIVAIKNPDGSLAYWFSLIPFTSPIVMVSRIPFGVPVVDVIISVILLIITFIAMTWIAAKIYRTGILMYGKKVTWHELWKWLRY